MVEGFGFRASGNRVSLAAVSANMIAREAMQVLNFIQPRTLPVAGDRTLSRNGTGELSVECFA
jgi:hypothetical protein